MLIRWTLEIELRYVWARPSCPNNNILLFYFWVNNSRYINYFLNSVIVHKRVYTHCPSFIKIIFSRIYIFFFQRVPNTKIGVLILYAVYLYIMEGRHLWISKHHRRNSVRGEICFKEVTSNSKLDQFYIICSSLCIWSMSYLFSYFYYLYVLLICYYYYYYYYYYHYYNFFFFFWGG